MGGGGGKQKKCETIIPDTSNKPGPGSPISL